MEPTLDLRTFEDPLDEEYSYWLYERKTFVAGSIREPLNIPTSYGFMFMLRRATFLYPEQAGGGFASVRFRVLQGWNNRSLENLPIVIDLMSTPGFVGRNAAGNVEAGQRKLHKTINYLFPNRDNIVLTFEAQAGTALPAYCDVLLEGLYVRPDSPYIVT